MVKRTFMAAEAASRRAMQPTQKAPDNRLQMLKLDIRQMADKLVQEDGKIDKSDVKALLQRATASGSLTKKDADDLDYVRTRYKDKFTSAALTAMNTVLGAFVQDEIKRMQEDQRKKKIEKHLVEIEERIEYLLKDRKMRDMNIDDKQRVLIKDIFGRGRNSV
jgi:hypothetical protein